MVGEPVTVVAKTEEELKAIVLPRGAVVRAGNGEMVVWQHVAPERFQRVAVRTQAVDGSRMAVTGALEPGHRVVVSGAELINQIR
jgi:hypothetical protein